MNKSNKKNRGRRSLLCWILAAAIMVTGIPVQGAMFDSAAAPGDIFSSGSPEDIFTDAGDNGNIDSVPDITVTPGAEAQPGDEADTIEGSDPAITPEPAEAPEFAVTPVPEAEKVPEGAFLVKFANSTGTKFYDALEKVIQWGDMLELPDVPGYTSEDGNVWKLEKDKNPEDTFSFAGGTAPAILEDEGWSDYIKDGVLTFYAVKRCKVTLYNNSGTAAFRTGHLTAYEGETIILPDMPSSKYINSGWTDVKNGRAVKYKLNSRFKVTGDKNLYLIRYVAQKVTFLQPGGANTGSVERLNRTVAKGSRITIPAVPELAGYKGLGWSLTMRDTSAAFIPGRTITVTRDLTFYAVRKHLPYTVTFTNNSGTSTSSAYTSLKIYAARNQVVTLPEVPKVRGYQNIGWTTAKGGTTPVCAPGSKMRISKNMKFYAVRRKSNYYTVQFYLGDGRTSTAYRNLSMKVEEGTAITFPEVPARNGYINKGWSGRMNSTTAYNRTKYTITRNTKFYAVQVKAVNVVLHYVDGRVYRTVTLGKGSRYTLPSVKNAAGYTFMGWSDKANQSVKPKYEPEERITVNATIHLYAVVFKCSKEEDIPIDSLPQADLRRFKRVIFVGDSRTSYMRNALGEQAGTDTLKGVEFVSMVGARLDWLNTTGYDALYKLIKDGSNSVLDKPTAVIFNLGINDLQNRSSYMLYLNSIAPTLQKKGCKLYYMSVNPINRTMLKVNGKRDRSEAAVREFNNTVKTALAGNYTYIDTYSYLKSTGYGFDNGTGIAGSGGTDDGLHYTAKTYKRIYRYCMRAL